MSRAVQSIFPWYLPVLIFEPCAIDYDHDFLKVWFQASASRTLNATSKVVAYEACSQCSGGDTNLIRFVAAGSLKIETILVHTARDRVIPTCGPLFSASIYSVDNPLVYWSIP